MTADTLVIQTAFLGDVVLTTPLLTLLAERHGPVDVVTTPPAAGLLEFHPAVAAVMPYDKRGRDRGGQRLWRLARRLRARRYVRAYLPHRSWRSAGLAYLAGVPDRTGFADSPAAVTYTSRIPRSPSGHEADRLASLAGVAPERVPPMSLGLTPEDRAEAERWRRDRGVGEGYIVLAPGSIWGGKRWPYYSTLAAGLECPIVVVGGAEDVDLAAAVVAAAPGRAHSAAGSLSLRGSAALIECAAVLVTNDSAPLHLAAAVGTPSVALFGPTVPAQGFAPRGPHDAVIEHGGLACRPCSAHGPKQCPLGHHRCMRELTVDGVAAAVATVAGMEKRRAMCRRD